MQTALKTPRCLLPFVLGASKSVVCCGLNLKNCQQSKEGGQVGAVPSSVIVMQQREVVNKFDRVQPPGTLFTITLLHTDNSKQQTCSLTFPLQHKPGVSAFSLVMRSISFVLTTCQCSLGWIVLHRARHSRQPGLALQLLSSDDTNDVSSDG